MWLWWDVFAVVVVFASANVARCGVSRWKWFVRLWRRRATWTLRALGIEFAGVWFRALEMRRRRGGGLCAAREAIWAVRAGDDFEEMWAGDVMVGVIDQWVVSW